MMSLSFRKGRRFVNRCGRGVVVSAALGSAMSLSSWACGQGQSSDTGVVAPSAVLTVADGAATKNDPPSGAATGGQSPPEAGRTATYDDAAAPGLDNATPDDGWSATSKGSTTGDDANRGANPQLEAGSEDAASAPRGADASDDGGVWWRPRPGVTWQWQLDGVVDAALSVGMYDIDMFTSSTALITELQTRGVKVICYVDVGTWEPDRPDSAQFPTQVLGNAVSGWPGERWLDIRASAVRTLLESRLALARQKGCDGVEPDNLDGYENDPGFPLTADDQLAFNSWVASSIHALLMSAGLKNDVDQVVALEPYFDFSLDEQCFAYSECQTLRPFIEANKAVFEVEYGTASLATSICPQASILGFDSIIKDMDLDSFRVSCQ